VFEKLKELIAKYEGELVELEGADINALVQKELERIEPEIRESIYCKIQKEIELTEAKISATKEAYEVVVYSMIEETTPTETTENTL
jgi:hypothetical protein